MNHFNTIFQQPWRVRRPTVTRYMEPRFTDDFYRDGSLRLSSFRKFRQHEDEARGDLFEGPALQTWSHPGGGKSTIDVINGGRCFVLCGASSEGAEIAAAFGTNDGFRILDTLGFADAVARHVPGFVEGVEGLCMYRDDIHLDKHLPPTFTEADESNPDAAFGRMDQMVREHAVDSFFVKRQIYSRQCEYRFIWMALGDELDYIDIKCPEARAFTERLPGVNDEAPDRRLPPATG